MFETVPLGDSLTQMHLFTHAPNLFDFWLFWVF